MAISATYLSIVNQALTLLGEDTFSSLDVSSPTGTAQKVIANQLQGAVQRVLRRNAWRSALVYLALGSDELSASVPDQSLYTISYDLPDGYIRMGSTPKLNGYNFESSVHPPMYKVHASKFLTYLTGWEIEYVKFHSLTDAGNGASVYSNELQFLIAAELAHKSCMGIREDVSLKRSLREDLEVAFMDACLADTDEEAPDAGNGSLIARSAYFNR